MNKKGFKGFSPGLICRGKQYAEHTTFEEKGGEICSKGMMHYCVNPFDVLDHYPLINEDCKLNEFAEVEAMAEPVTDDGRKFATKKLHVGAKLDFKGFVKACFDFVYESVKAEDGTASGEYSKLAASGNNSQLAASGERSVVAGIGINNRAKAALGCWIVLAEWEWDGGRYVPVCVEAGQIDGEKLKADTWYMLKNGEFVEVE